MPDYVMFRFSLGGKNAVAKIGSVVGILLPKLFGLGTTRCFPVYRPCSSRRAGEGKLDRPTMAALAVVSALLTPCKAAYVLRVDLVFRSSEAVFFKELCFFV